MENYRIVVKTESRIQGVEDGMLTTDQQYMPSLPPREHGKKFK